MLYIPGEPVTGSANVIGTRTVLATLFVWLAAAQPGLAAELVMFRRVGCPYCHAWDRAVGPAYPNSELGRQAPLRMVDIDRDQRPRIELQRPVVYTPTFVLVEDGREIGRIEGYAGEGFFWGLLENLVRRLPAG